MSYFEALLVSAHSFPWSACIGSETALAIRGFGGRRVRDACRKLAGRPRCGRRAGPPHSHSIVAGGLELMSYTARFTPRTSLITRVEMRASTS